MTSVPTKVWKLSAAAEAWMSEHRQRIQRRHPDKQIKEYEYALSAFRECPFRHPCKHEFLILCWLHQWPHFQFENDGVVNYWVIRMAKGLCYAKRLNMLGCASSGKTAITSAYVYTLWKAYPLNSSIFLSTTSGEAAQTRTWGQVKRWHESDRYPIGKRIESLHLITLDEETKDDDGAKHRDYMNCIKVVMVKKGGEGQSVVASICGRKNDVVVWVCDEMPHMDIGILEARLNLNSNPFHQFIGLGNAPREGDPMFLDAAPFGDKYADGWRSVTREDLSWPTKSGLCLYFNGAKSPNLQVSGKTPFPKIMTAAMRDEFLQDSGGEDTPGYWKQFFGFPPTVEIGDKVLTYKLLEQNGAFTKALWLDTNRICLAGLDLGFRADGDPCIIQFGRLGKNTDGRTVMELEEDGVPLVPQQGSPDAFETQIAKKVVSQCQRRGCKHLALDVTGDGGIMLQHIEREAKGAIEVLAVSFSNSAEDRIVIPNEKRTAREMFANMVAQLWGTFRVCVLNKVIYGMAEQSKCTGQFCARKMDSDDRKRMTVEPKREMKKRIRRSPDNADAACLLSHLAIKHGLSGIEVKKAPPKTPKELSEQRGSLRYSEHATGRYGGR